ncbi:sphingoid long-chain base transporter RSB1 protein [Rutstroemia sp. NJR-2017a WRK4]|nr:sphingoid long-chain base transporter RSB1 protein [Rutstroemia sp. NJR-2017a WRK4]
MAHDNCTSITPACPVEYTIYGYTPSLGFNAFFLSYFLLFSLIHLALLVRYKTYFYSLAITIGCLGEVTGYIGRVLMNHNPWSTIGFEIQISCLIFSPSFIVAGVYITLQRMVQTFGTEKSRIPVRWYTGMFITFDFVSLLLQAIGGGIAASAGDNEGLRDKGTDLMIAGIVWQVATLIFFAALVIDYFVRTRSSWEAVPADAKAVAARRPFTLFCLGVTVAFVTIFGRCLYRIAEMVGGWANPIMRDEAGFVVMEGFMIVIAVLCLTVFHPGYCFPQITEKSRAIEVGVEEVQGGMKKEVSGSESV